MCWIYWQIFAGVLVIWFLAYSVYVAIDNHKNKDVDYGEWR